MATKATKKKLGVPMAVVTIREVEEARPCSDEYFSFLHDLKSNPSNGGHYDNGSISKLKKSKYAPDDPISLLEIAKMKSSSPMSGEERLTWLLSQVPALASLSIALDERVDEIRDAAFVMALQELSDGKLAKKKR